jgi:N-acetylglucosaminyldiphosphoundecaprenol N-acetyl-beta-D-mannosaminyltransferase
LADSGQKWGFDDSEFASPVAVFGRAPIFRKQLEEQRRMSSQIATLDELVPRASRSFKVLGVRVHAVQIPDVVQQMRDWISARERCRYIAVTGMHGVSESRRDPLFKTILNEADLVVPDGMPLVWLGKHHGHPLRRRVYGPELMQTFCRETGSAYRHFLYGGMPGVPELLSRVLNEKCGINVVGHYSPPFRPLTPQEDQEVIDRIHAVNPDILWVGLSTPKQERWMYEHRSKLRVPVLVGVGAAFDMNSGRARQAPGWMQENGLEWSFRLLQEPRRLWRRYLISGPQFVFGVASELLSLRRYD